MGSNLLNWSNYYEMIVVGPLPFCNKDEWGVVVVMLDINCQVSDGISTTLNNSCKQGVWSFPISQVARAHCVVVCPYWNVIPHLVSIWSLVNRGDSTDAACRPANHLSSGLELTFWIFPILNLPVCFLVKCWRCRKMHKIDLDEKMFTFHVVGSKKEKRFFSMSLPLCYVL